MREVALIHVRLPTRTPDVLASLREPGQAQRWVSVLVVPAAAAVGVAVAVQPMALLGVVAAVIALWMIALGQRVVPVFHVALGVILLGYAFFGRGFAYIGAPPVYIGEMVLALALLAGAVALGRARFGPLHALILAFMVWGLVRTVPYLGTYGIDALRDAVMWGYAFFAVAVSITVSPALFPRLAAIYRRVIPYFLLWVPIAVGLGIAFGDRLPRLPGAPVTLFEVRAGELAVQLAGIGAFLLLGFYPRRTLVAEVATSAFWLAGAGIVAALNRGAMAALAAASATLLFIRRSSRWTQLGLVALMLLGVVAFVNPQVVTPGSRAVSFDQIVQNVGSVFTDKANSNNEATKIWRLRWWGTIIDYTIGGRYFWTGKGFGVNLANDDGFQVLADKSLRAPHSMNFDVLARSGVPGLLLWVGLNLAFGIALLRSAFRAHRAARVFWVQVLGWIFVFWLAALINASFDVYLEGPQGGIWFWTVIGLGLAAMRGAADEPHEGETQRPAADPAALATTSGES